MKVLLDEDVPHPLARMLLEHRVHTVAGLGWGGIKNGELLKLVQAEGFDVLITGDKNLKNQNKVQGLSFGVVVLSAINWPVIRKHIPAILRAVESAVPGVAADVDCGTFLPRRRPRG